MNFLADESCAGPVIRALREAGHDVIAIAEAAKGADDEQVLERAVEEKRVLITEDCEFGEMVMRAGAPPQAWCWSGLTIARLAKPATVIEAVAKLGSRLKNAFAVVEPGRVRISGRP